MSPARVRHEQLGKPFCGQLMDHLCPLFVYARQMVFVESHDSRIPRIAFFALESIEAGEVSEARWKETGCALGKA